MPKSHLYLVDLFGIPEDDELVDNFGCFYDASLVQPAHMYLTKQHLCFHIHGHKGKEKVMRWTDIVEMKKKNTAKVIPNAIVVKTRDGKEFFFAFVNRHHVYKVMNKLWKGSTRNDSEQTQFDSLNEIQRTPRESNADIQEMVVPIITERKIEDDFDFVKDLGSGAFSVVKLAKNKKTGAKRAVKIVDKIAVGIEKKEMLDREIDILRRIQHPNIISITDIYETPEYLYLVMEVATGGELFDAIVKRGKYSERDAARIVRQIAEACRYLHSKGIVHRDLKPENLLLSDDSENAVVKIADFGLSKIMDAQAVLQTACGTPGYVAPEVLMGHGYHQEVDVWSIGVITYILLVGYPPFYAENNAKLFDKIMAGQYAFTSPYWDKISAEAKDLIRHLLVVDPKKRFTSLQVLQHPWIKENVQSTDNLFATLESLKKTNSEASKAKVLSAASVARMALN